jgi:hypothetical protein
MKLFWAQSEREKYIELRRREMHASGVNFSDIYMDNNDLAFFDDSLDTIHLVSEGEEINLRDDP